MVVMTRAIPMAALALLALLVQGCDDAVIGTEPCVGAMAVCDTTDDTLKTMLDVNFTRVVTSEALDLPVLDSLPSPCDQPCDTPITLLRAGDAAWTVARSGQRPGLQLLTATGLGIDVRMPPPAPEARLEAYYVSSDGSGRALAHLQWTLRGGAKLDEVALLDRGGAMQRVPLTSNTRAPLGAVQAPSGFFMFEARDGSSLARMVTADGALGWQQARFPLYARQLGSSAVATRDGYTVSAGFGVGRNAEYGLLSLDLAGTPVSFGVTADSTWLRAELLPLGDDQFAVAAESELAGVLDTVNTGNLDVVVDEGRGGTLRGFRLERYCFHPLLLNGFSADPQQNLYVSTMTGDVNEPRGLLCELPVSGAPRCFRGQPNQLFGAVAALGSGALLVASGESILRVQLPAK
jgi:hypothetical protein